MGIKKIKQRRFGIGTISMIFFCLWVSIGHVLYVFQTRQYPQWDEHNYLSLAIKYLNLLHSPSIYTYPRMLAEGGYLQPLYSFIIALLLIVLGTAHTYLIALLLNGVLYIISVITTYLLAKEYFDETVSLIAAILFAFCGNALFYLHFAYTETAVTTWIVLSLLFLQRSHGFTNKKYSVLSGVAMAFAVLTRWIAPVFYGGPLLVTMVCAFSNIFKNTKNRNTVFLNIAACLVFGIAVPTFIYFIPNWHTFISYVQRNQVDASAWVAQYRNADMANTFSTHSVMYYFNILSQNTVFFFSLFVIGLLTCLVRVKKMSFVLLGFIVPYVFLSLITVWKEDRFIVPIYPVMAIISASFLSVIPRGTIKIIVVFSIVVLASFSWLGAQWGMGPMGKRGLTDMVLPSFIHHPRRIYLTPLVWPPTKEYANAGEITKIIEKSSSGRQMPVVTELFSFEPLENALYSITSYQDIHRIEYKKLTGIQSAEYILTKNNDPSNAKLFYDMNMSEFTQIGVVNVPMDNSTVTIYKRERGNK